MKLNKKGFTLIELLAVMTILAVLSLIAVPNIVGVVKKNRDKTMVEDAKKFISMVEYEKAKKNPSDEYTLRAIDKSEEIENGPNNSKYNRDESKVKIKNNKTCVCLIETGKGKVDTTEDDLYSKDPGELVTTGETCSLSACN